MNENAEPASETGDEIRDALLRDIDTLRVAAQAEVERLRGLVEKLLDALHHTSLILHDLPNDGADADLDIACRKAREAAALAGPEGKGHTKRADVKGSPVRFPARFPVGQGAWPMLSSPVTSSEFYDLTPRQKGYVVHRCGGHGSEPNIPPQGWILNPNDRAEYDIGWKAAGSEAHKTQPATETQDERKEKTE